MKLTSSSSLKQQLTETVALWGVSFFVLLGLCFYAFFQDIEIFLTDKEAEQQLDMQMLELTPLLVSGKQQAITAELQAYAHDPSIAALAVLGAVGIEQVATNASLIQLPAGLNQLERLNQIAATTPDLHLYTRKLYGYPASLIMVKSSERIGQSLSTATKLTLALMMVLLLISIKALHFVLNRRLLSPVKQLHSAMESSHPAEFVARLPDEFAQALVMYDRLQQQHNVMKTQFLNMMDALPGCFWWSDNGSGYSGISDKADALLHSDATTLAKSRLWSWIHSPAQQRINLQRLQLAIEKREVTIDFAYQARLDNTMQWFGETVIICYSSEGLVESVYGIINNISGRKQRQKEQSEKIELDLRMKATATLVGGIAHEFNNILAGMTGNLFLIRQKPQHEMTPQRIKRIEQLIDHAASMIEQMLAFALQSNLAPGPIEMHEFIRQFYARVLPTLDEQITLDLKLDSADGNPAPLVHADAIKMQEALMQLLHNAIDATSQTTRPHITIRLSRMEGNDASVSRFRDLADRPLLHMCISDNGCGMPEDVRERVFEPFFTTKENGKGTGLGLPMVYGQIRQLGGRIDVESSPGNGTTVHIYLPVQQPEINRSSIEAITHGHRETILIIDDEEIYRESSCEVLSELGSLPLAAASGEEGISIFAQHRETISLVISDIIMPGMSGLQTFRRIRKIRHDVPFLFITAYDQTHPNSPELYESGCEVLDKPFRIATLSLAIERALHPNIQHS